jgi:outer membrane protein
MKNKTLLLCSLLGAAFFLSSAAPTAGQAKTVAVVSFKACIEGSKIGKQQQAKFKELEKQMKMAIDAREKELNELAAKLKPEFLDTLTPEKENELRASYEMAVHEFEQMQGQQYSLLHQTNDELFQELNVVISQAAKEVAAAKGFELVVNDGACFFYAPSLDISSLIIEQLDKQFANNQK